MGIDSVSEAFCCAPRTQRKQLAKNRDHPNVFLRLREPMVVLRSGLTRRPVEMAWNRVADQVSLLGEIFV